MTSLRAEAEGAACCNGRDRSWNPVKKIGRHAQPTNKCPAARAQGFKKPTLKAQTYLPYT